MPEATIRCLPTRRFWDQDMEYLRAHVTPEIGFVLPEDYTTPALVEAASRGVDILLGDVPAPEVLEASKGVRLLQVPWTGMDQVDFDVLRRHGFPVCNSHGNAASVAELGMALLLSCMKQLPSHHHALRQGNWRRPGAEDCVMPDMLSGKDVGLIGYGAIGRKLAGMLSGFGATLHPLASEARQEGGLAVLGADRLDHLCGRCDVLIVSAPLTPETRGMIGKRQFELMKSSLYLVNISRGAIIDEETLYHALEARGIAGAGIDVWYRYPRRGESAARPSRFPFETLDNVVMSPHRGGMARGELPHLVDAVENMNRLAAGKPLINRINMSKRY
ncbi:MAG: hypothetical protein IH577_03310 [Deltaproteobacteria bacterium]|nr:hypothetical protein [Deltaproteobacteria bacterium]